MTQDSTHSTIDCAICGETHLSPHKTTLVEDLKALLEIRGVERKQKNLEQVRKALSAFQERLDYELPGFTVTYLHELRQYVLIAKKWQA